MRLFLPLFFCVLLVGNIFFPSCNRHTKTTEKALDSLALMAWEAEAEITGLETETWKTLCAEAKQNVEFINYNFKDTMSRETALALDNYARAAHHLENYINEFETLKTQIRFAAGQAQKLKEDFAKSARTLDSINTYIARETKNITTLNQAVTGKTNFARQQAEIIQNHASEIRSVVEKLKEK